MIVGLAVAVVLQIAAEAEAEETAAEEPSVLVGNREHQDSIKACTASVREQLPHSARIDLALSADETGAVTSVSASAPKELSRVAACLEARAKHWRLPAFAGGLSVSLPLLLHGGSP